jgi:prefoldin alpha subunit
MEDNEEPLNEQELAMKFQMFEQQIRMLQEQLQAVEQAIVELGSLNLGLDELIGKKDNEILSPVGRGIYARSKLLSEELLVDIGDKNFVTKSIPETKKILQEQIKKLEKIREELNAELDRINTELTDVFMKSQKGHIHNHEHGEDCECEKECVCDKEGCTCEEECNCEKKDKKKK